MRPRKEDLVQLSIRLPVSLKNEIDKCLIDLDIDFSTWCRHACREKLERYRKLCNNDVSPESSINDAAIASAVEKYLKSQSYTFNRVVSGEKGVEKAIQRV